ncbi:MAG: Gfo/Idh/MocA family oxidoreductase [Acidobacteriota bacterium]|nr:Gfo/Idh/MocA family oxidoreductase [Acidobacteriota bacterium]
MPLPPGDDLDRRQFLRLGGAAVAAGAGAGLGRDAHAETAAQAGGLIAAPPIETVRIGMVGIGLQGGGHVENFLKIPGCRITAVCDIRAERTGWAASAITAAGHPAPAAYTRGPRDFERLCETEDLDLVFTATPWEWHVPVMLAAMKNGKHAATEVPAAMTLDDCWALVETAEKQARHCVMMENCNYDRAEMMVFNIVRQGALGEVLHAEGGYLHDLRAIKFEKKDEGLWRRAWSMKLDGNPYPTHGLGPVANCLDINRGDRFDYLVSMSGPSRGLYDWAREHFPADAPERREKYVLGDVNTSLIKTALGKTVMVQHCTNLPRPYSRINLVQGTKGIFQGYPNRLYIEGRGREHQWVDASAVRDEFEHPLWRELETRAAGAGHGGMDFIEDYRLIKCLREGVPTDMNVYDAAALSAVVELSVQSNAKRARAVDVPDFTRGRWRTNPRLGILGV